MNIIIGKFGKSIIFDSKKWGIIGGDSESAILIWSMAQLYPNDKFYIVSRNDYSKLPLNIKLEINKNKNIIDVWEFYNKSFDNQSWLKYYFESNNIKIDFGLLYSGLAGNCTIKNMMYLKTGEFAKPMSFSKNYTGIITNYLNQIDVSYMEIGEDSRFFPLQAKDLYNRSRRILSVKDTKVTFSHIKSQENQEIVTTKTNVSDVGHSYMFLMNEDRNKLLKFPNKRNTLIGIFMHGTASHHKTVNKYSIINDYILNYFPDTIIYGKWDLSIVDEDHHKNIKEIPMTNLHETLYDTKYTISIGGSNGYPTSSKLWKMLIFGIIPFFYKKEDIEKFSLPDFLYINSPEDLKNKIEILENNNDYYTEIWNKLQNLISAPDLWNGDRFFNSVEKWINYEFDYDMKRSGNISYKNSSIFVNEETNDLKQFFN